MEVRALEPMSRGPLLKQLSLCPELGTMRDWDWNRFLSSGLGTEQELESKLVAVCAEWWNQLQLGLDWRQNGPRLCGHGAGQSHQVPGGEAASGGVCVSLDLYMRESERE